MLEAASEDWWGYSELFGNLGRTSDCWHGPTADGSCTMITQRLKRMSGDPGAE